MLATLATLGISDDIEIIASGSQPTYKEGFDGTSTTENPCYRNVISKVSNWFTIYKIHPGCFLTVCQPSDKNPHYKKGIVKSFGKFKDAYSHSVRFVSGETV